MITATLVASALAFLQAGAPNALPGMTAPTDIVSEDVAFDALNDGRPDDAIAQIELLLAEQPESPALLINLAAAYLQRGDTERAITAYRRAANSKERYELELADGTWVDSRTLARHALADLRDSQLAIR